MAYYKGERLHQRTNGSATGLILAAADYAEGKGEPPPELTDLLRSRRFESLPYAGGWKQQPARFIIRAIPLSNIYDAFKRYQEANRKPKEFKNWAKENKEVMKVINEVGKIRNGINN